MSSADSAGNLARHGKPGELTENICTFAIPFENQPYTFRMQYEYDSYTRKQKLTYPDGVAKERRRTSDADTYTPPYSCL